MDEVELVAPEPTTAPKTQLVVEKTGLRERPSPEAEKKVQDFMDKINKEMGAGTVWRAGDKPSTAYKVISTGSLGLNRALGIGGLPRGRIVEIYGHESSGKTTIALHAIADAQAQGLKCLLVDAEYSYDPEYATALGVNVDDLLVCTPDYGEQGLETADKYIVDGSVQVVVIDSVAALIPKAELEGEHGDSKMGLHARLMSQACRKMTASVNKTETLLIFINQLRMKIGIPYGNPEVTTGGMALQFYASVRLDVRRAAQIKDGDEAIGNRVRVKVVKNKCAPPSKIVEFDILYGEGINRIGEIVDQATERGIIQKAGSWYSYGVDKLGQGRETVIQLLKDNEPFRKEIEGKLTQN